MVHGLHIQFLFHETGQHVANCDSSVIRCGEILRVRCSEASNLIVKMQEIVRDAGREKKWSRIARQADQAVRCFERYSLVRMSLSIKGTYSFRIFELVLVSSRSR